MGEVGRPASGQPATHEPSLASRLGPAGECQAYENRRPWQPHERNYSGGRFGVWHDSEWTMLRVEAGIADATASIRKHEAWDLALLLSPELKVRMNELFEGKRTAENALHQFTWAASIAPLLRKIADEWDCDSAYCENASSDCGGLSCPLIESEQGCRAVEADELRQFAEALETRTASVDTLPKGQDREDGLGACKGSAVPKADAQP